MKSIQEMILPENPALGVRCWRQRGKMHTSVLYSHWHSMMEIVYSRKGSGIQQINQNFCILPAGTMAVIGPNQLHSYAACSAEEEMDLLVLQFDIPAVLENLPRPDTFCEAWMSGRFWFPEAVPVDSELEKLLEDIYQETAARQPGYVPAVIGNLLKLLVILYRLNPVQLSMADQQAASLQNRRLLSQTFQLISEHYSEEGLSLEQAARSAGLSVTHFCRLFKMAANMGFHEYLTQYRVSQAEQLFHTGKNLTEIAFSCGFGSVSAFTRAFERCRGCTPGRARKERAR